jgi:hypothetical protein
MLHMCQKCRDLSVYMNSVIFSCSLLIHDIIEAYLDSETWLRLYSTNQLETKHQLHIINKYEHQIGARAGSIS